jgi:hypothetical protein
MDANGFDDTEAYDLGNTLSVEFTLLSGETVSVRESFEAGLTEETVRQYADVLIGEIGSDTVRTFSYWWEDEFYVDAVRMHEVAALSVSTVTTEEEDEDEDDWET